MKESCFKLVRYPDWYTDLVKAKKEKKQAKSVNMAETYQEKSKAGGAMQQDWMVDLIKQEVAKALRGAQTNRDSGSNNVNFIQTTEYAGMTFFPVEKPALKESWIIDTAGASSHICINDKLFDELTTLEVPISVNFPNGTAIRVTKWGTVIFNGLRLTDTLYIPNFTQPSISE